MKGSIHFEQSELMSSEQAAQQRQLKTVQHGLLLGWGSVLTFIIMVFSAFDPYGLSIAGPYEFGRGGIVLWLALLFVPGFGAFIIWRWPTWQQVPMASRRGVILSGLALSWVTYLSFVAFHIAWNFDDKGFVGIISFVGAILGLGLLYMANQLHKQIIQEGELFP